MNRKILGLYYSISLLFLLVIIALAGFRLRGAREQNLASSRKTLERLRVDLLSVYLAEGAVDSPYFRTAARKSFDAAPQALGVVLYSRKDGILYAVARRRSLLASQPGQGSWTGQPGYELQPLVEARLTVPFAPGLDRDLFLDGLFRVLLQGDLYEALKEVLYVLLVYVLITAVTLVAALTSPAELHQLGPGRQQEAPAFAERPPHRPEGPPAGWQARPQQPESLQPGDPQAAAPQPGFSQPGASPAGQGGDRLFSPATGLGWQELLPQKLDFELDRASSFDQDLSLLLLEMPQAGADQRRALASLLLEAFPFRDLAFELGADGFAVILPDKDLDQALRAANTLHHRATEADWSGSRPLLAAIVSRAGRLIGARRLLKEAGAALRQARKDGRNPIVAFRADAERYRRYVASRTSPRSGSEG